MNVGQHTRYFYEGVRSRQHYLVGRGLRTLFQGGKYIVDYRAVSSRLHVSRLSEAKLHPAPPRTLTVTRYVSLLSDTLTSKLDILPT